MKETINVKDQRSTSSDFFVAGTKQRWIFFGYQLRNRRVM